MKILPECQNKVKTSKVKIEEEGRKAVFLNATKNTYIKTKIDGCCVKNEIAADWLISKDERHLIVELKGKNVEKALKQIEATTCGVKSIFCTSRISALIVCSQYPRIDTKIQKAKNDFPKCHPGFLHIVSSNKEHIFEELF